MSSHKLVLPTAILFYCSS